MSGNSSSSFSNATSPETYATDASLVAADEADKLATLENIQFRIRAESEDAGPTQYSSTSQRIAGTSPFRTGGESVDSGDEDAPNSVSSSSASAAGTSFFNPSASSSSASEGVSAPPLNSGGGASSTLLNPKGASGAVPAPPSPPQRPPLKRVSTVIDDHSFARVAITGSSDDHNPEAAEATALLRRALQLREKHCYAKPLYYWGACKVEDHPFSPSSPPVPHYPGVPRNSASHQGSHEGIGIVSAGGNSSSNSSSNSSTGGGGSSGNLAQKRSSAPSSPSPVFSSTPGALVNHHVAAIAHANAGSGLTPGAGGGGIGHPPQFSLQNDSLPSVASSVGFRPLGASASDGDLPSTLLAPSQGNVAAAGVVPSWKGAAAPASFASSAYPNAALAATTPTRSAVGASGSYNSAGGFHLGELTTSAPHETSPPSPGGGVGVSSGLISPSSTGIVATKSATDNAKALGSMLSGSNLVTMETGKQYGNLFHRRRLEPKYEIDPPLLPPLESVVLSNPCGVARIDRVEPGNSSSSSTSGSGSSTAAAAVAAAAAGTGGLFPVISFEEFHEDYLELHKILHSPIVKSYCFNRLTLLDARFELHRKLNYQREMSVCKSVPHRDFYNVRKVDTHVHHSACMNQKHLLTFIKHKLKDEPETVVIERDGKSLTLRQVFESLKLTAYDLSVDTLDMHADATTFHRFDRFNLKYSPIGQSRLREIFVKTDNYIKGRFLAELTKEVLVDLEATKYSLAEYRLSIYGRDQKEWSKLSKWVIENNLISSQVRWMIQIPRLYEAYREQGVVANFQAMLDNIFKPLFAVTLDPSSDPTLHCFLGHVVGIDSVDDESKVEDQRDNAKWPAPSEWTSPSSPPYFYWSYYIAANTAALNKLRASRGFSQFSFRPHCGEAGDVDHLAAAFLHAESINHGINLRRLPSAQYLYYLAQVGIAVSPLSNNKLFLEYSKNPFYDFFARGLNVSLSTDDPLMLSFTREALLEEYAVAAQVWKLSPIDMCEIARNSVLQSGLEFPFKVHFVGRRYAERGPDGNDINGTNVPDIRLQYRMEVLHGELESVGLAGHEWPEAAQY